MLRIPCAVLVVVAAAAGIEAAGGHCQSAASEEAPQHPAAPRPDARHREVTISGAPPYTSSVESLEIMKVELADVAVGSVVRVTVRNLVDEAVIGIDFEIHGSNPKSWHGYSEVAMLRAIPPQEVIAAKGTHVVEISAGEFHHGDKLRLAAVVFASGRGEGDTEEVDDMRREAASHPPPDDAPN